MEELIAFVTAALVLGGLYLGTRQGKRAMDIAKKDLVTRTLMEDMRIVKKAGVRPEDFTPLCIHPAHARLILSGGSSALAQERLTHIPTCKNCLRVLRATDPSIDHADIDFLILTQEIKDVVDQM